jgi:hypothetical protein
LLQQAIETKVQVLLAAHSGRTLDDGRAGEGFSYLAKIITGAKFKNEIGITESTQVAA